MIAAGTGQAHKILCIPTLLAGDGTLRHMFEVQADQRQDFVQLTASGAFGSHQVTTTPPRDYRPADHQAAASQ